MRGARAGAAVVVAAVVLLAGAPAAWADDGSGGGGATPAPGPITLTAEQSARVCDQRIPNALRRIDGLAQRAGGNASVVGSTAWLQERAQDARSAGRTDVAERLQRRIDARPAVLDRLAGVRSRVVAFQQEHCS